MLHYITNMAYASNYTFMYGFSLLDDLHNFFPEILYDNTLFPEPRFEWFRHRASTLFPSVFPRQMNMYRIYHGSQRQAEFNTWVNSQTIGIQGHSAPAPSVPSAPSVPPVPTLIATGARIGVNTIGQSPRTTNWDLRSTPPNPTVHVTSWSPSQRTEQLPTQAHTSHSAPVRTYSQVAAVSDNSAARAAVAEINNAADVLIRMSQERTGPFANIETVPTTPLRTITRAMPAAPAAPARRTSSPILSSSDVDILTALLSLPVPNVRTTAGTNEFLTLLTNNSQFQDVTVVPTIAQIDAGSSIVQHDEVPADESCAICQEHVLHNVSQPPWRRLNCSHQFHTSCIMPWFQRNVHCPVCRADIREMGTSSRDSITDDNMSVSSGENVE